MVTARRKTAILLAVGPPVVFLAYVFLNAKIIPAWSFRQVVQPGMSRSEVIEVLGKPVEVYSYPKDADRLGRRLRNYNHTSQLDLSNAASVLVLELRPPYDPIGVVVLSDKGIVLQRLVLQT